MLHLAIGLYGFQRPLLLMQKPCVSSALWEKGKLHGKKRWVTPVQGKFALWQTDSTEMKHAYICSSLDVTCLRCYQVQTAVDRIT